MIVRPVAERIEVEPDARRPEHVAAREVGCVDREEGIRRERRILGRLVVERHVHPEAGRQRQPLRRRPFVLRVESQLLHLEVGDRALRSRRGSQHPLERRGRAGLEAVEAVEGPDADLCLEERIVEALELVRGPDRDPVGAGAERDVVLHREDVLVERIELGEPLGAGREKCVRPYRPGPPGRE